MTDCKHIQNQLVEFGRAYLEENEQAQEHVLHCNRCQAFLVALNQLDEQLPRLPEHDVGEPVFQKTLKNIQLPGQAEPVSSGFWQSAMVAIILLLAGGGLIWQTTPGSGIEWNYFSAPAASERAKPASRRAVAEQQRSMKKLAESGRFDDSERSQDPPRAAPKAAPLGEDRRVGGGTSTGASSMPQDRVADSDDVLSRPQASTPELAAGKPPFEVLSSDQRSEAIKEEASDKAEPLKALRDARKALAVRKKKQAQTQENERSLSKRSRPTVRQPVPPSYSYAGKDSDEFDVDTGEKVQISRESQITKDSTDSVYGELSDIQSAEGLAIPSTVPAPDVQVEDEPPPPPPPVPTAVAQVQAFAQAAEVPAPETKTTQSEELLAGAVESVTDEKTKSSEPEKTPLAMIKPAKSVAKRDRLSAGDGLDSGFLDLSKNISMIDTQVNRLRSSVGIRVPGNSQEHGLSEAARRFKAKYQLTTDLSFQPADGYWANTYIPGDPQQRLLRAQLQQWKQGLSVKAPLDSHARPVRQPFDVPAQAAMAVYAHADRRAVEGPARLRLQVGLQATQRQSGQRSPMNIAVVVDMDQMHEHGDLVRAFIKQLLDAKQSGDRFSLAATGAAKGVMVGADDFRFGPLSIALDKLFAEQPRPLMGIEQAVRLAQQDMAASDDPTAQLGSSLIMVLTAGRLQHTQGLESTLHTFAVQGFLTSMITVGDQADSAQINQLVLAGQGNRRVLQTKASVVTVIDRELHAASRVVARALRLRIRLKNGAKLINVIGSHRLDLQQSERVRKAEQSIDQRLSRNLGIESDRGDDEEGIQIVIPHFYSGDNHVVLLDIWVPGPGVVADVRLRYKDLVFLRNATTESAFRLAQGKASMGPLELNVWKNLLTYELTESLQFASNAFRRNRKGPAVDNLLAALVLSIRARTNYAQWHEDPEFLRDELLLKSYLKFVRSTDYSPANVAASLAVAAYRKKYQPSLE